MINSHKFILSINKLQLQTNRSSHKYLLTINYNGCIQSIEGYRSMQSSSLRYLRVMNTQSTQVVATRIYRLTFYQVVAYYFFSLRVVARYWWMVVLIRDCCLWVRVYLEMKGPEPMKCFMNRRLANEMVPKWYLSWRLIIMGNEKLRTLLT